MKNCIHILGLALLVATVADAAKLEYIDGSAELLTSGDVDLYSSFLSASFLLTEQSELDVRIDFNNQDVEYRPHPLFDPFGSENDLSDNLVGATISYSHETGRHTLGATATTYSGFRNYSSLWIDEYYRQQYSSGGIPGVSYEDPEPNGYGLEFSERFELIPSTTYLTASVGYLRDQVAPGYEIGDLGSSFELIRGDTVLHSWTGSVEIEGVLNKRMRTRQTIRLTRTTSRELRTGWNGALNIAVSQNWISRTSASFAHENPNFEAWSVSQTFEYSVSAKWSLGVTARYYEDTGQIESANLVSSAAPALDSQQFYLSLRRSNLENNSSFSLSIGPYTTNYAPTGIGTERFINLYADRDWWWGRIAIRHAF
ncbi:MAG: hypothetical protein AB3N63_00040 [Puniceicoccaceae bacterium]